jgi:hypothetical protein
VRKKLEDLCIQLNKISHRTFSGVAAHSGVNQWPIIHTYSDVPLAGSPTEIIPKPFASESHNARAENEAQPAETRDDNNTLG